MANEERIFGPPGTGKTTLLINKIIPDAVDRYGGDNVMISSFTRAAARELVSRGVDVRDELVGTLHSICFHGLGRPDLTQKHIKAWNSEWPDYAIKGVSTGSMDDGGEETSRIKSDGDELYSKMQLLRARMVPAENWPARVQRFKKRWDDFKTQTNCMDFDDLIEKSFKELPMAPNSPSALILDEAQDFTPIQLKLVRTWGVSMDSLLLCGDDDQAIYSFLGASPEAFLNPPVDPEYKTILAQSHRVPKQVHDIAMKMILKVKNREPKDYLPRTEAGDVEVEGEVTRLNDNSKMPEMAIDLAQKYAKQGKSVMFLASCSYMLNPLKSLLRNSGIPFHNPYRRSRRDWNPLSSTSGVSSADLVLNFLDKGEDGPYWNVHQFVTWAKFLRVSDAGLIRKFGKKGLDALEKALEDRVEGLHTTREVISQILSPGAVEPALNRDLKWFEKNLKKNRKIDYVKRVLKRYGKPGLSDTPKTTIGTIHSVKGGESDVVFLMPDLSNAGWNEYQGPSSTRDTIIRLFYVGMTRARETLVLMDPPPAVSSKAVNFDGDKRYIIKH